MPKIISLSDYSWRAAILLALAWKNGSKDDHFMIRRLELDKQAREWDGSGSVERTIGYAWIARHYYHNLLTYCWPVFLCSGVRVSTRLDSIGCHRFDPRAEQTPDWLLEKIAAGWWGGTGEGKASEQKRYEEFFLQNIWFCFPAKAVVQQRGSNHGDESNQRGSSDLNKTEFEQ